MSGNSDNFRPKRKPGRSQTAFSYIQTFWKGAMDAGIKIVSLDLADLEVHGNTAIEVGRYTLTTPAAGGTTTTDKGKYVVVWKRQGPSWSLAIDTFNTSLPATP
jgi:ketosteroid isomerase-like protein